MWKLSVFQRREEHAKVKGNEIVNGKVFQRRFFTVLEHLLLKMIFWKSYFNTCFKDDFYKTVLQKLNLISKMAPLIFLRRFFKNWLRFNMLKHVFVVVREHLLDNIVYKIIGTKPALHRKNHTIHAIHFQNFLCKKERL